MWPIEFMLPLGMAPGWWERAALSLCMNKTDTLHNIYFVVCNAAACCCSEVRTAALQREDLRFESQPGLLEFACSPHKSVHDFQESKNMLLWTFVLIF